MHNKVRFPNVAFGTSTRPQGAALVITLTLLFTIFITLTAHPARGQTYRVIYNFNYGLAGASPNGDLTMDSAGNLYGTTPSNARCAPQLCGTVFQLSNHQSSWIFALLHYFNGGNDGSAPDSGVIFGRDGSLYGTTETGGGTGCSEGVGCGTVYRVTPSAQAPADILSSGWAETVLYPFTEGGYLGAAGNDGDLLFDNQGNLYGTRPAGGTGTCWGAGCGFVYQLVPSDGGWDRERALRLPGSGRL